MNFLGHALLSFGDKDLITGNLIADYVKGKMALEKYPEKIRRGILLHRQIDAFTDIHPATKRARIWFREAYGLYAGAIMDSLYDHFLANDPRYFKSEKDLFDFSQEIYRKAEANKAFFPQGFARFFPHMKSENWLYNYRTVKGMEQTLAGLYRRANYMPDPGKAYGIFIGHYHQLAQCYYDFIDETAAYVKVQLSQR